MVEECRYCSDVMKNHFSKALSIAEKDNGDFEHYHNVYFDEDVNVRDQCHITGKYRDSAYKDCNIKFKLNHKFTVISYKLKKQDSHLNM